MYKCYKERNFKHYMVHCAILPVLEQANSDEEADNARDDDQERRSADRPMRPLMSDNNVK